MDYECILAELCEEGESVLETTHDVTGPGFAVGPLVDAGKFSDWTAKALAVLESLPKGIVDSQIERVKECSKQNLDVFAIEIQSHLKSVLYLVQQGLIDCDRGDDSTTMTALESIELICRRFHRVCLSLRRRRKGRTPLTIEDEYDVQYLFEALLNLFFDNICPEEWTPRYAGKNSRIDFVLPDEGIVIELKKTRDTLNDAEIGDQLIIDLERYRAYPYCHYVVCFVYDPEKWIRYPRPLCENLNKAHEGEALVIIEP